MILILIMIITIRVAISEKSAKKNIKQVFINLELISRSKRCSSKALELFNNCCKTLYEMLAGVLIQKTISN